MPLILVPTPLGNLRDITLRAIDTLRNAGLIVAEDTRTAQRLLHALEIPAPELMAFHAHSPPHVVETVVARAREQLVAVTTDAGMPGINDPGSQLVRAARAAAVALEVLPGPCAFVGAAVLSGFATGGLCFEGFIPRTAGERRTVFGAALRGGRTTAWYESPHRIRASLATLADIAPDAPLFLLREYTKRFEQQLAGTAAGILAELADPVRGEITLVIAAQAPAPESPPDLMQRIEELARLKLSTAAFAKRLAAEGFGARDELYRMLSRRGEDPTLEPNPES